MSMTVGVAPDSWGIWFPADSQQTPWHRFLDEVVEAGFEWIELGPYGYLPTSPATLRSELDRRGLQVCGCLIEAKLEDPSAWPQVEAQMLEGGALATAMGAQVMLLIDETYTDLRTGEPTGPAVLDQDAWRRLIDTTHKVAQTVRDRFGLRLAFHAGAETHVEYEEQIEQLLADTDPNLVFLCLDIGHHAYRGGDPVAFIREHHERICHLHIKNIDAGVRKRVEDEKIPSAGAVGLGMFCEPEQGMIDYHIVLAALKEVDYNGFVIVEQDMYPVAVDRPLPIAKRSRAYLREVGFG